MVELQKLFGRTLLGNGLQQWIIAGCISLGVLLLTLLVRRMVRAKYTNVALTPQVELWELPLQVASRTSVLFLCIIAAFAGLGTLDLPKKFEKLSLTIVTIAAFWQVGAWASAAVGAWLEHRQRRSSAADRAAVGTLGILGFIARALIWALALLLTLDNLGINITALVAGLGIGGIAVALAVQNVLGDLLASLSITLDRPFVVGDAVTVGDFTGTVEQIGVKSVRLRSVTGEEIIMPNADLLSSRVRNWGRLRERRVEFTLGVALDTARDKLARLPDALRTLIERERDVRFDRAHFAKISASALEFTVVYFVTLPDYNRYMDIQQSINLNIIQLLEREAIELAYPTQRFWLHQVGGDDAARTLREATPQQREPAAQPSGPRSASG
jgi:small-conductance mechanosensitive channel